LGETAQKSECLMNNSCCSAPLLLVNRK